MWAVSWNEENEFCEVGELEVVLKLNKLAVLSFLKPDGFLIGVTDSEVSAHRLAAEIDKQMCERRGKNACNSFSG